MPNSRGSPLPEGMEPIEYIVPDDHPSRRRPEWVVVTHDLRTGEVTERPAPPPVRPEDFVPQQLPKEGE